MIYCKNNCVLGAEGWECLFVLTKEGDRYIWSNQTNGHDVSFNDKLPIINNEVFFNCGKFTAALIMPFVKSDSLHFRMYMEFDEEQWKEALQRL